jgi:hypothetical protein
MLNSRIGDERAAGPEFSSRLQQVTFNSVRKVLPDHAIDQACRKARHRYRRRVLTPIVTVLHMILAAIWPEESFAASWQLLWDGAVGIFPTFQGKCPSSGSVAKARRRLPMKVWNELWAFVGTKVQDLSEPLAFWRGHRVVLADGTCLSMPDRVDLHDDFGTSTGRGGKRHYPLARLVTLALANTMTVLSYALGRYDQSEISLLRPLLRRLRKGDLLVGDRHFAGANLYAEYRAAGLEFLTRVHQRLKLSRLQPIVHHAADDFVTDLSVLPDHRRKDPTLPARVRVRLIRVVLRVRGRREVTWLVTSLLDASRYPAAEIRQLYARRWRIETLFLQVKVRLSADVLRSKTAAGLRKELAARLIAVNVVRAIMLEAAAAHGADPMALSFVHALRAILAFAPILATAPGWKLPDIYAAMLCEIAAHRVRPRPGRNEPRAIRREMKHYPRLRITRAQWRARYVA